MQVGSKSSLSWIQSDCCNQRREGNFSKTENQLLKSYLSAQFPNLLNATGSGSCKIQESNTGCKFCISGKRKSNTLLMLPGLMISNLDSQGAAQFFLLESIPFCRSLMLYQIVCKKEWITDLIEEFWKEELDWTDFNVDNQGIIEKIKNFGSNSKTKVALETQELKSYQSRLNHFNIYRHTVFLFFSHQIEGGVGITTVLHSPFLFRVLHSLCTGQMKEISNLTSSQYWSTTCVAPFINIKGLPSLLAHYSSLQLFISTFSSPTTPLCSTPLRSNQLFFFNSFTIYSPLLRSALSQDTCSDSLSNW
ncbi:hypothetical protein VP01_5036g1 [Puccinia sorghi]|uniref:Uncharacterized protein n=1 Tax=Puccinia sorghi TaxID=27349 RepID=A0A0L6UNL0_9BASI|nr:hypothetical protein VP01_5036g1 [Puccinia sorghi]